ncbi:MAG TPA: helix-turn-helix transcriptional regulator [Candidatus Sulfotelmatobacter sp.]|nr:helix-turn-helix transcriptional regulator [Candidatus Sulfotelmatobacter sp.]
MADVAISVGPQIRAWRQVRGLSQFELASRAGFSTRHVSFIETGRSNPSREAVLVLGEVLELPLRERNRLLQSAGFADVFRETPLSADEMAHMRGMLQFILDRHLPYAAVALDRHWNLLLENRAVGQFFPALVSPALTALPSKVNVLRVTFHPEGSRRWIVNWPEVERHLLRRAELEFGSKEDPVGAELLSEIRSYASPLSVADSHTALRSGDLLLPIHIRTGDFELRLFSTIMTLCRPHDITLQELRIETWFPADQDSERCWRQHFVECPAQT